MAESTQRRAAAASSVPVLNGLRARDAACSVFGEVYAFRAVTEADGHGSALSLANAETLTRAMRGALLRYADDPPPAMLSGHEPDGQRLDRPHAACLALPGPRSRGGIGTIGGVAVVLPRAITFAEREAILLGVARWQRRSGRLVMGRLGSIRIAPVRECANDTESLLAQLTGPSRQWATLTAVALHRNPGNLNANDPAVSAGAARRAEKTIADACEHVGLPRPTDVRVMRRSVFPGAPSASAYMPYPRHGTGFKRVCVHVSLRFAEPAVGPVLLGVGRYFGVGLLLRNEVQP